ncbi:glycerophosphodiester phosphodiesterase [Bacillus sp. LL01]|uniref:glycerophosphodiester phosphodiesterase family protein n=1 Tax=Bacillus sp. LL01 TaxID=1665556 RepID=UPI00064D1C7F|nr:glycerophosphodiester phosphodiesterase family protein [Bacillus sp. LL01]KMJ60297.1 glycerophosphodiester phosphodiesterase [Bacillus sp. LL01]
MKKVKMVLRYAGGVLIILLGFMFLNNTSLFMSKESGKASFLAHRGVHQTFSMEMITGESCTAEQIYEPEHSYIENTIASMEEAFRLGASVVELDVHPTTDGEFAVFHDWTLECRTDGEGVTREHSMEELRQLDVGYGYTTDGGKTYPFHGKGVGLIPTLAEVLEQFPDQEQELLIHIKSDDPEEGELLANYLESYPIKNIDQLAVYGGDLPISVLKDRMPELKVMSKVTMKSCLIPYLAIGWTGFVPEACEGTQLHIPEKIGPFLWGWSGKFQERMEKVDTKVIIVAGNGGFSEGFDSIADLKRIPDNFSGYIWTNRIDVVFNE